MRRGILKIGIHATLIGAALLAAIASERVAYALQGGEDPALLPVLVDKRFGENGRHQFSASFSTSMVSKFVEATGVYGTYAYGFSDLFALELGGGYFFGRESSIMTEVREKFPGREPPLSDLYQMVYTLNADLMVIPVYGKMSFAAELDPAFDLFILAGAGIAGVRRQIGAEGGQFDNKVTPAFNFGFGLRFYFSKLIALRLEFRDYFYPEPGKTDAAATPGEEVGGFTFNLHFQGGLQVSFGGDS